MKFPVIKAFGATFAYLAQHAVVLFKALWLPALLLIAAMAAIMPGYLDAASALMGLGPNPDPNEALGLAAPMMKSGGLILLVSAVVYPMMVVAALRHVVRGDAQKLPFYLGFGGDELRALGAYVLIVIMMTICYLVFVLAVGVLAGVLSLVSPAVAGFGSRFVVIAGLGVFLWFVTRLSVAFPASLATRSLGIAQSWRATKGNSARLVMFWILIGAVIFAVALAYAALFMGDAMAIYGEMATAGGDQEAQLEANRKLMEIQRELYDIKGGKFWPFIASTYVYTLALMALTNVAAGIAWRYLTDRQKPSQAGMEALAA